MEICYYDYAYVDRSEIIDRINKCLALGDSPNENEAKTALLMARKLMATYSVGSTELKREDIVEVETGITYTTRTDNWMALLAELMASKHGCIYFARKPPGKQKMEICFIGSGDMSEICKRTFVFTVIAIKSNQIGMEKAKADSFARGFIAGLKEAYHSQEEDDPMSNAIVLASQVPQEVKKYSQERLTTKRIKYRMYDKDVNSFDDGYLQGRNHLKNKINSKNIKKLQ